MASNSCPHPIVFIFIGIFFLASAVNCIPAEELDSMLDTLQIRGYKLFCNAIVTSDLQIELLSSQNDTESPHSFTFFAPIDSSLFALDMTQTATSYIDTLRFHIVPRRLAIIDLLSLPVGSSLPTLLFRRYLNVTQSPGSVAVGGVDVAFPGLFYGRDVAVHGLSGIISLRSSVATGVASRSPVGFSNRRSFPPRTGSISSEHHSVMAPSPSASPPVDNSPPVNRKAKRETADASGHFLAASPFNRAVRPPEPDESSSPDNLMIHAPEDSNSSATSPFNPVVHPPEPDEPNPLDNLTIHAPEDSHSRADSPFDRVVYAPEPDEPKSDDNMMILAPEESHSYAASPFNRDIRPPEPDEPISLDNQLIHAPEDGHVSSASPFNSAVLPPEPDESKSLENPIIHAPEAGYSLAHSPVIHGISPASSTESAANILFLPPVVSHALTPTSESLEYHHSSISAPPLEYSDAEVPTAMSPDVWLPKKLGVILMETFKGDSDGRIKTEHYADKVPKMPQRLIDAKKMPGRYKLLDAVAHCADSDVGLGLQQSTTHQCTKCSYVCE